MHPNVAIGAGARIGDDCVIHSQASIRERVVIGHRVTLHNGVVVGSDGYGFARQKDGTHLKIPQHGDVVIEDDVEIGANSTIDRPAIGETRISAGTKIDNLVHIAHGVAIGRRVLLAAQVGIAGSTTIGDDVMMAGQTGVTGHITRRRQGDRGREERGAAIGGGRRVRHRLSGVSARRLAEGVGGLPPPAVAEASAGRARAADRRIRGEARRRQDRRGSLGHEQFGTVWHGLKAVRTREGRCVKGPGSPGDRPSGFRRLRR